MDNVGLFDMEMDTQSKIQKIPFILDNITFQLEEHLLKKVEGEAEDGLLNIAGRLKNEIQEEYDKLIGEDTDKKRFIKSIMRIFALLLNTKVDTVDKIKKILRFAIETTLKIWQGQK